MKYKRICEILLIFILPYLVLGLLSLPLGYLIKILFGISFLKSCIFSISGLYLLCAMFMGYIIFDKSTEKND